MARVAKLLRGQNGTVSDIAGENPSGVRAPRRKRAGGRRRKREAGEAGDAVEMDASQVRRLLEDFAAAAENHQAGRALRPVEQGLGLRHA